jgi:hypothetical protein
MRRLVVVALSVLALSAVAVSQAFAAGKNPATSCGVGFAVSEAAHELGGLGKAAHEGLLGNPGESIQAFHESVKETCNT